MQLPMMIIKPVKSRKENFYDKILRPFYTVLRIRDDYPGSVFFSIPDPNFFHPVSRIRIKEFRYFNPKMVSK